MKLKRIIIIVLCVAAAPLCFFVGRLNRPASVPEQGSELRVYDGALQWFDGDKWADIDDISALESGDPFAATAVGLEPEDEAAGTAPTRGGGTVVTVQPPAAVTPSGGGGGGSVPSAPSTPVTPPPTVPEWGGDYD